MDRVAGLLEALPLGTQGRPEPSDIGGSIGAWWAMAAERSLSRGNSSGQSECVDAARSTRGPGAVRNLWQADDGLDSDALFAVLGGLIDLVEIVESDELVEGEASLRVELHQFGDEELRDALAL